MAHKKQKPNKKSDNELWILIEEKIQNGNYLFSLHARKIKFINSNSYTAEQLGVKTMAKKLVKTYIYEGLGFPIELNHVEMIVVHGEYVPKIDVRAIAERAIKDLILQKKKLNGNQIKFIRSYFSLSLRDFSKIVNESHTAVKKWENFRNKPTNMDPNIETRIRLYTYDKIFIKNKNDKLKFYEKYHTITEIVSQQQIRNTRHLELAS